MIYFIHYTSFYFITILYDSLLSRPVKTYHTSPFLESFHYKLVSGFFLLAYSVHLCTFFLQGSSSYFGYVPGSVLTQGEQFFVVPATRVPECGH